MFRGQSQKSSDTQKRDVPKIWPAMVDQKYDWKERNDGITDEKRAYWDSSICEEQDEDESEQKPATRRPVHSVKPVEVLGISANNGRDYEDR